MEASGARTSVTRPASKRSRRRGLHVGEVAREAVGGEDDLGAGLVQRVEGVEELLLRADLGLEELDVVDEQDVDAAVGGLEGVGVAAVDGADEVVGEGLGRGVADGRAAAVGRDVVPDRVQEVRLAEAGRAADEERVVGDAGHLGDREGGGVREAVGVADDELLEGLARVEAGREGARRSCGGAPSRTAMPARAWPVRWSPCGSAGGPATRRSAAVAHDRSGARRRRGEGSRPGVPRAPASSGATRSTWTSGPSTAAEHTWSSRPKRSAIQRRVSSDASISSAPLSSRAVSGSSH